MVSIRLMRQGAKKNPQYIITVVNKMAKRDGAYLEKLGYYFPKAKTLAEKVKINPESLKAWIAKGAQPSQTVGQLVKSFLN